MIVTFDLRYCMRTNRQTRTIIIYIDCINNFDTAMEKQNSGIINEVTLAPNLKLSSFTEHPDTQLCWSILPASSLCGCVNDDEVTNLEVVFG